MANKRADWASSLHSSDAIRARRWIKEDGGEAALRRISAALPPRDGGRPEAPHLAGIEYAARLFVCTPGLEVGGAAAAARVQFTKDGRVTGTPQNFRRQVSEGLQRLSKAQLLDFAVQMLAAGSIPRADLFPDLAAEGRARQALGKVAPWLAQYAAGAGITEYTNKAIQQGEHIVRLVAFMKAFDLPSGMPISVVARMFEQTRLYVSEEIAATKSESASKA